MPFVKQGYAAFASKAFSSNLLVACIKVIAVSGSTPRDTDAVMLVSNAGMHGTIGGGRLEWLAIAEARQLLRDGKNRSIMPLVLGPQTGQCCGGKVTLEIERLFDMKEAARLDQVALSEKARHTVIIFGAGHVGQALAEALSLLPFQTKLIDTRAEVIHFSAIPGVAKIFTDQPEKVVENAVGNSAFVILTHDHALDSRIAAAVLERGDFSYLGIIGSKTKRQLFTRAFKQTGIPQDRIARIVCPIGGMSVRDKRPAVIAAVVAAELAIALLQDSAASID